MPIPTHKKNAAKSNNKKNSNQNNVNVSVSKKPHSQEKPFSYQDIIDQLHDDNDPNNVANALSTDADHNHDELRKLLDQKKQLNERKTNISQIAASQESKKVKQNTEQERSMMTKELLFVEKLAQALQNYHQGSSVEVKMTMTFANANQNVENNVEHNDNNNNNNNFGN